MSKADDRAFLLHRHAACKDRIAELRAKSVRTDGEKLRLTYAIEAAQFCERELEKL
jgi:hypothetical protein